MSSTKIPLDMVQVASPCTASWDAMSGDDRTRFCDQCSLHVYNLSDLTKAQAEALIEQHEGHLCVRFYQRFDGTIITKDCPVGWRAIQRKVVLVGGVAVALFVGLFSVLTLGVLASPVGNHPRVRWANPIVWVRDILFPPRQEVMGGLCPPPVAPPPAPAPGGN